MATLSMRCVIKVFPADPEFWPDPARQELVAPFLQQFAPFPEEAPRSVRYILHSVHREDTIDIVLCAACGALVPVGSTGHHRIWGYEWIVWETEEPEVKLHLPCCGNMISYRDLPRVCQLFDIEVDELTRDPAAFADPLERLANAMGCSCRRILEIGPNLSRCDE